MGPCWNIKLYLFKYAKLLGYIRYIIDNINLNNIINLMKSFYTILWFYIIHLKTNLKVFRNVCITIYMLSANEIIIPILNQLRRSYLCIYIFVFENIYIAIIFDLSFLRAYLSFKYNKLWKQGINVANTSFPKLWWLKVLNNLW